MVIAALLSAEALTNDGISTTGSCKDFIAALNTS